LDNDKTRITRGRVCNETTQAYGPPKKGHVLAHKTWVFHDPFSRLEKIKDTRAES